MYNANQFFQAGDPLDPDAPSYIERPADAELLQYCLQGEYCNVLTPRQMGKTSLIGRTIQALKSKKIQTVVIDLQSFEPTPERLYYEIADQIVESVSPSFDMGSWWDKNQRLGHLRRLSRLFTEIVLRETADPIVIFFDEIDWTIPLPFSDDLFLWIRSCRTARPTRSEWRRVSFVLVGTADPAELIKAPARTPYNIGKQVILDDFQLKQMDQLVKGFELNGIEHPQSVLKNIFDWTQGHPYLTQKMCAAVVSDSRKHWSETDIDTLVQTLFPADEPRKEHNLQFIQTMIDKRSPNPVEVLRTYRNILQIGEVEDEAQSPVKNFLKLCGLVRTEQDLLRVRNRIYARAFSREWLITQPQLREAIHEELIIETRVQYDVNLITKYGSIEFVGQSVRREVASRGLPMEDIYIPLSVIPETAEETDETPRQKPLSLLEPGKQTVIWGEPGAGKSALMRFLALAGISEPLQRRYNAKPDERLPILVILRRYANALKQDENLTLIDHITESIQADFTLKHADVDFVEYYLKAGQAILLFDGLDEMDSHLKEIVRDRIRSLLTTYPFNTAIVTSRIIGYDAPFRFDADDFTHYRLTRLRADEIERFVRDWYATRIEDEVERNEHIEALIRVLNDPDYESLQELARNPLLLSIIALVHRIDAVLPDQRVILYQRCTETLLETWHTWKFRAQIGRLRGRDVRRNRERIETIAHWMHTQTDSAEEGQGAIVPYHQLHQHLTEHIETVERVPDPDAAADLADEFLDSVKERAGLLIEIGENQYSFVHLAFQEYLTASYIRHKAQWTGAEGIWEMIADCCAKPQWREVIRLLVAELIEEHQAYLIEQMLDVPTVFGTTQLLCGLLLDGIEPTEDVVNRMIRHLLSVASTVTEMTQLRTVTSILRAWRKKEVANANRITDHLYALIWEVNDDTQRMALALLALALNLPESELARLAERIPPHVGENAELFKPFFLTHGSDSDPTAELRRSIERLWVLEDMLSLSSNDNQFAAAVYGAATSYFGANVVAKRAFDRAMVTLIWESRRFWERGPFFNFVRCTLWIGANKDSVLGNWARAVDLDRGLDIALDRVRARTRTRAQVLALDRVLNRALDWALPMDLDLDLDWCAVLATPQIVDMLLELVCDVLSLEPRVQWMEALRLGFLPDVPQRIDLYDESIWKETEDAFANGTAGETEIYRAASQLLFDVWLKSTEYYKSPDDSLFRRLAELTRDVDAPPLRIAHCIRDIAYGDESRFDDLQAMINSDEPAYREIFERCYWVDRDEH